MTSQSRARTLKSICWSQRSTCDHTGVPLPGTRNPRCFGRFLLTGDCPGRKVRAILQGRACAEDLEDQSNETTSPDCISGKFLFQTRHDKTKTDLACTSRDVSLHRHLLQSESSCHVRHSRKAP